MKTLNIYFNLICPYANIQYFRSSHPNNLNLVHKRFATTRPITLNFNIPSILPNYFKAPFNSANSRISLNFNNKLTNNLFTMILFLFYNIYEYLKHIPTDQMSKIQIQILDNVTIHIRNCKLFDPLNVHSTLTKKIFIIFCQVY